MKSDLTDDDADASFSGMWPRLLLFPAVVGLLFIGGVYWLRVQLDKSGGQPEAAAVVEVQLLPRPDPLPIPISPTQQSSDSTVTAPSKASTETPADLSREILASLPTEERPILEPAVSTKTSLPSTDAVPNAAMMQFRSDLLHHIAKFQRYPRGAEIKRLQGTVHAVFSIDRDGKLLGAWVKASSGQILLDQAAIDTIRRAQPMPHIPSNLPNTVKVEVALGFDPP
jgi:periplasmic protein TonB